MTGPPGAQEAEPMGAKKGPRNRIQVGEAVLVPGTVPAPDTRLTAPLPGGLRR